MGISVLGVGAYWSVHSIEIKLVYQMAVDISGKLCKVVCRCLLAVFGKKEIWRSRVFGR